MTENLTVKHPWLMPGDCLERMREIPCGSVDMVLCDLPYGTTQNLWDSVIPVQPLWEAYRRILKPHGVVVLTASQPFSSLLVASNLDWFKYQWIWVKSKITGVLNAKRMPVRKHEQVLIFSRGPTTYNAQGLVLRNKVTKQGGCSTNYGVRKTSVYIQQFSNWPRDVIEIPSEGKVVHPTQKPALLFEYLIKTCTNPGNVVLDNCFGSGTTGVACANTGRLFIGIERDPHYFDVGRKRIEQAIAANQPAPQGGLFDGQEAAE